MTTSIIIARYKEDISWINNIESKIDQVYVYNKFYNEDIMLPNVGREAHTYLYHIINNYNNLSDNNIFVQGNPFDHCRSNILYNIIDNIHTIKIEDIYPIQASVKENKYSKYINTNIHPYGLFLPYFMQLLFDINMDRHETVEVTYGAQFVCKKSSIVNRPIEFYKFLLKFLLYDANPLEAYIFERLWLYIFNSRIVISDRYKFFI